MCCAKTKLKSDNYYGAKVNLYCYVSATSTHKKPNSFKMCKCLNNQSVKNSMLKVIFSFAAQTNRAIHEIIAKDTGIIRKPNLGNG